MIQKPSKHALAEKGPWTVYWRESNTDSVLKERHGTTFADRELLLTWIKAKILALRAGGRPARLSDFHIEKPLGVSVVKGLLYEWDAQFRPPPPKKPRVISRVAQLRARHTKEGISYLHNAFGALARLSRSLQ